VDQSDSLVLGSIAGLNGATSTVKVGIGTTTPLAPLDIAATGDGAPLLRLSTERPWVFRQAYTGSGSALRLQPVTGLKNFEITAAGGTNIATFVGDDANPRVGIGTTSPINKFEVIAPIGGAIYGRSGTTHAIEGNANGGGSVGVIGINSSNGPGVSGVSVSGPGVIAFSNSGSLVEGWDRNTLVRKFHIDINGTYFTGSDFAEAWPVLGNKIEYQPGDVLVLSTKTPGTVEKTSRPYDTRVAGIYSTRPGVVGADKNGATRMDAEDVPVAILGIVPTKVTALGGRIRVGDLLTTSTTPGYAMRCISRVRCIGSTVGKALQPLHSGKGVIKALVMLK
jgi:hypothetical protein